MTEEQKQLSQIIFKDRYLSEAILNKFKKFASSKLAGFTLPDGTKVWAGNQPWVTFVLSANGEFRFSSPSYGSWSSRDDSLSPKAKEAASKHALDLITRSLKGLVVNPIKQQIAGWDQYKEIRDVRLLATHIEDYHVVGKVEFVFNSSSSAAHSAPAAAPASSAAKPHNNVKDAKISISGPEAAKLKIDNPTQHGKLVAQAEKKLGRTALIDKIEVKFGANLINASSGQFYRGVIYAYEGNRAIKVGEIRVRPGK